jgi:hypothetical protein
LWQEGLYSLPNSSLDGLVLVVVLVLVDADVGFRRVTGVGEGHRAGLAVVVDILALAEQRDTGGEVVHFSPPSETALSCLAISVPLVLLAASAAREIRLTAS